MAKEAKLDMEILIVDDDSNDGSLELAQSLSKMYPLRFILRKTKKGLSSAVLNGFQEANSDILVVRNLCLSISIYLSYVSFSLLGDGCRFVASPYSYSWSHKTHSKVKKQFCFGISIHKRLLG